MLYPNPHLQLMGVLQFSAFDLYANQQGRLSPKQTKFLEGRRLQQVEAWIAALMLFWAGGLLAQFPLLFLLFITTVAVSVVIGLWRRGEDDLGDKVESVTGRPEIIPGGFLMLNNVLRIGEQQFHISRALSAAFVGGRIYRVYFTSGSRTILSAEALA